MICVSTFASFSFAGNNEEAALAPYLKANINWRQFEGETINFVFASMPEMDAMVTQIPIFEKLTGIKVDYEVLGEEALRQKTMVDLISRTGQYDVAMIDFMLVPQLAIDPPMIEPLNNFVNNPSLTDPQWFDYNDLISSIDGLANNNGKDYGIGTFFKTTILYYRKDLFEKAGISVPDTLDEFWNAAKVLNNPPKMYGVALRGLRGQGENIYTWTGFFRAKGGKFFKDLPNDMTPVVNSPEGIAGTKYYADILQKFGPIGASGWTWLEVLTGMQQGKIAMAIDASDFTSYIEDPEKSTTVGKWGYALVPRGEGGRHPSIFAWLMSINAASKKKGPAWLFLEFCMSKPSCKERSLKTVSMPRQSLYEDPEMKKIINQNQEYYDILKKTFDYVDVNYRPRIVKWKEIGDQLGVAVESAISGEKTAQKAMNDVQKVIEKALETK